MGFMDKLSSYASKAGDALDKGVKNVSDGSKKFTDKARIKKEISQAENELNAVYVQMGKKCYELNSESPSAEFADMVNDVNAKLSKIDTLRNELSTLEDKLPCPKCGNAIARGTKFCSVCGDNVENIFPVVQAAPIVSGNKTCSNCGAVIADNQKFCEKCGTPVSSPAENVAAEVVEAAPVGKVCSNCGAAIADNQKFCEKCGTPVNSPVENVAAEVVEAAPVGKVCSNCGAAIAENHKFCEKCGTPVANE
jgi:predicted amidophosphoribosyltransferase